MEHFFRPRQMNSHTSLVSKLLSPKTHKKPLSLHEILHEEAAEKERNKSIREHVSSKAHVKRQSIQDIGLFDEHRQRRREHWETHYNKHWRSAPKINNKSKMLSAGSSFKGFSGEWTHCANTDPLLNGVYRKSLADSRPIFELDVRPIETRYRMSLQSSNKNYYSSLSLHKAESLVSVDSNQSDAKDKNEQRKRPRVRQPVFNLPAGSKFGLVN